VSTAPLSRPHLTDAEATPAEEWFARSRPRSREAYWQRTGDAGQLLVTNGSRIFNVPAELIDELDEAAAAGEGAVKYTLDRLGLLLPDFIDDEPLQSPPLCAISLAIAQKCNLGCTYCYASQGDFGGPAKNMPEEVAHRAADLLIESGQPGTRLNIAFLGGEPLLNRPALRSTTERAARLAAERDLHLTFSITTNGTLLREDDAEFFERHGFAVTVSLDGLREEHDRQRPFKRGGGSFDEIMRRVQPLLRAQRRMQVSVRATVTPSNLNLPDQLDHFLAMGFHSVGYSPMLNSPTGEGALEKRDFDVLLEGMIGCAGEFERRLVRGERYAFSNIINALRELHRGTHRPYPCGAGAGYLGVSADGDLSACHRFVGDSAAGMGDIFAGLDRDRQNRWLAERHVHRQEPCASCWARYLCSGGCHHEVISRGRNACDYIRGWLSYCLAIYGRIKSARPDWFDNFITAENA
jgi:uncharacterized protein